MNTTRNSLVALVGAVVLSLTACRGVGPFRGDPLVSTSWTLVAYGPSKPLAGTTITATFQNGQVRGSTGCNDYGGPYRVRGNTLTVGALAMTEKACLDPEGAMEQEGIILRLLGEARTFQLNGGKLVIVSASGEALTFAPQKMTETPPTPTIGAAPPATPVPSPADYPRPQDEARPATPAAIAAKHLAGWLHVPLEGIRVLSTTQAEAPPEARKCRLSAELPDPPAEEQLITLEAGGKKYGYYVSSEALLLCPVVLP